MKRILMLSAAILAGMFPAFAGDYEDEYAIISTERSKLFLVNDVGFGMIYALNGPDQMAKSYGLNFTIDYLSFRYDLGGNLFFDSSLGIEQKSFRLRGDERFLVTDGVLDFAPYPEKADPKFSSLSIFSVNMAAGLRYEIGNGFGLAFAPILGVPFSSRLKTKYKIDGEKQKDKSREIGLVSPITCDLRLMFTFNHGQSGIYVKYSPTPLIKESKGPQFTTFSFGIIL